GRAAHAAQVSGLVLRPAVIDRRTGIVPAGLHEIHFFPGELADVAPIHVAVGAIETDAIAIAHAGDVNFAQPRNRRAGMSGIVSRNGIGRRDGEIFGGVRGIIVGAGNVDAQNFSPNVVGVLRWAARGRNASVVTVAVRRITGGDVKVIARGAD